MGLSWETYSYYSLELTSKDDILNEAGLVNFVCIVFKHRIKMLKLSSMENLIEKCNLKASLRNLPLTGRSHSISKTIDIGLYLALLFFKSLSTEWYRCTKFLIKR